MPSFSLPLLPPQCVRNLNGRVPRLVGLRTAPLALLCLSLWSFPAPCCVEPCLTSPHPPLVLLTVPCPVLWETANTKLTPLPSLWLPSFEALTLLLVWNFKVWFLTHFRAWKRLYFTKPQLFSCLEKCAFSRAIVNPLSWHWGQDVPSEAAGRSDRLWETPAHRVALFGGSLAGDNVKSVHKAAWFSLELPCQSWKKSRKGRPEYYHLNGSS